MTAMLRCALVVLAGCLGSVCRPDGQAAAAVAVVMAAVEQTGGQVPADGGPETEVSIEEMIRRATAEPVQRAGPAATPPPGREGAPRLAPKPAHPSHIRQLLIFPFLACLVLTGIHCYLGIHVIARGVIFVDLALAQIAALGSVVALLAGLDPHGSYAYGFSLAATVMGAALLAGGRMRKQVVPQEAIIGIIYAVSSALALLLLSKAPAEQAEETLHMLVGRILFVSGPEVGKTALLYAAVGLFHWWFRRQLLAASMEPELAGDRRMYLRWWDFLFYSSFGLVVTSSVQMAGVLLVFSFLIVPAVCSMLLVQALAARLLLGWLFGFVASAAGLYFSVRFDLPPGESIIATFGGLLVAVACWRAAAAVVAGAAPVRARC